MCRLGKSEIAGSNPTLAFKFQRNKMFLPRSLSKIKYCWEPPWSRGSVLSLRTPGSYFDSCVCRAVSSHHPQEVLLAQFSLYVNKGGLKPHSFHLIFFVRRFSQTSITYIWTQIWQLYLELGANTGRLFAPFSNQANSIMLLNSLSTYR